MPNNIARYAVTFGLSGCYMPDSHAGVFETTGQRELSVLIKDMISLYDLPKSLFNDVRMRKLWAFIKRNGSSCAHFSLHHEGYSLAFHGLTEEEYSQQNEEV